VISGWHHDSHPTISRQYSGPVVARPYLLSVLVGRLGQYRPLYLEIIPRMIPVAPQDKAAGPEKRKRIRWNTLEMFWDRERSSCRRLISDRLLAAEYQPLDRVLR
jgi:hypothetical protein